MAVGSSGQSSSSCSGKFIYQKLSSVRWVPGAEAFLTGSWEDESNSLSLWELPAISAEPKLACKMQHKGDVNQLRFVNSENVLSASSDGSVRLFHVQRASGTREASLQQRTEWDRVHHGSGISQSCNCVDSMGDQVASAGEDGRVFILAARQGAKAQAPLRRYEKADSCSLTAVTFVKHDEVCVANMRGQLKLFDLRSRDDSPAASYLSSECGHEGQAGVSCLCRHPTQAHVVCSGAQDGRIAFWDLRQERLPVSVFRGHEQSVNEVQFHPQQPEHFFSCSENGDVWHWNGANVASSATRTNFGNQFANRPALSSEVLAAAAASSSNWFANEAVKHRVETTALLPPQSLAVNTLDAAGRNLVVGGDNEAVYVIANIFL